MKNITSLIILIVTLFFVVTIMCAKGKRGVYLQPEDGPFTEINFSTYYSNVYRVLIKPTEDRPLLTMVVLPSFQSEWMSGILKIDSNYYTFSSISSVHIWQYESLKSMKAGAERIIYSPKDTDVNKLQEKEIEELTNRLPKNVDDVKVTYHKVRVNSKLYDLILKTWITILKRTRYTGSNGMGLDGVDYHFSVSAVGSFMNGKTWSPPPNSINDLSVQLGSLLKEHSIRNTQDQIDKIQKLCNNILDMCRISDK